MTKCLNEWIKSIVIFTVFSSLVMFLLPDEKYRKYIRTGIGFVMIIIVINPILSIGDLNDYLSFDYVYEAAGSSFDENDRKYYRDLMENIIEEYINENYSYEAEAAIEFDDVYSISRLELTLKEDAEDDADASNAMDAKEIFEEGLRAEIAELYGVAEEDIFISFR